ncbi:MAG: ABC transporter ATP-binding protein [Thermodesulfovibrionales bacterium]|nr:ABC transporter ATP-binding protein [Thermodesulfovibrionales bacterium]
MQEMLRVEDLWLSLGEKQVLKGVNFSMNYGEIHVLFGPNGAGKTSLIMTMMGFPRYKVERGRIYFKGEDITDKDIYERARLGMGISFQRPPTVRGVTLRKFIEIISDGADREEIIGIAEKLNLLDHLDRGLNEGFSGGEMKRSELFQLMVQRPNLVFIDEPESGVDLENIALVGEAINTLLGKDKVKDPKRGAIIITHTGYILDYVNADKGYIIFDGRILCGGNPRDILSEVKKNGYRKCAVCR